MNERQGANENSATPLRRAQFPVAQRFAYVNHAGVSPLPRAAAEALSAYAAGVRDEGALAVERDEERMEAVRASGARLMGVPVDDVAFVKNTTEGLGFVASGLAWRPGDRVVVPMCEFPSNLYPWIALRELGVEVETIDPVGPGQALPLERFEAALRRGRVRVVAASWVQFGRGHRIDVPALAALAHAHGAHFCLDVIQGLGVLPAELEAWGVDFAAADGHKWLLGPEGIGFLYVRSECRNELRVLEPGWNTVVHRTEWENRAFVPDPSARRFEGGTANVGGIAALGASTELLLEAGVDRIWGHVEALTDAAARGLEEVGADVLSDRSSEGRSAIVTFTVPGHEAEDVCARLEAEGIVCSPRGGGVRVAPHGYNMAEEIDRLVEAVGRIRGGS